MSIMMYPSPLPAGCHEEIITHTSGRYPVVVFPNGEIVDKAIAPFWRYDNNLEETHGTTD